MVYNVENGQAKDFEGAKCIIFGFTIEKCSFRGIFCIDLMRKMHLFREILSPLWQYDFCNILFYTLDIASRRHIKIMDSALIEIVCE